MVDALTQRESDIYYLQRLSSALPPSDLAALTLSVGKALNAANIAIGTFTTKN
jgi:hypothetical protein